ncbi:TetR/AcrR family transcriptional regulator [Marivita sp. XM-24bin2]|jgi:AcrR family transcriptional regulator|uniref:TetR/AcrR family transcriptional regulator n=1 Tax=unclassified Marivita TaxID=2632480 RepID=UPI000D7B780B|nr:TetR/AcrR family transcriptional regulator [Marivita sp. XM-24bin2]MCR9110603.1 TetR/AcrR family transcriptional regulator [Paracoccaceae bacterium]PWL37000.1 MAG: TetR/AcrR family transcriptional regulator [Marivita sp. XM-24bin2]
MATAQAQIRKGRKFDQVVEGAREIFLRDGFEGASVDDIARAAGVSKATLYSYFPDKRLLFMEVATSQCAEQARISLEKIDSSRPPQEVLTCVAQQFLGFIYSEMGQRIFRICVAEADRFPQLGQEFYHSGPMILRAAVVEYLKKSAARGELAIEDFNLAADQFAELCKADVWPKLLFGIISSVPDAEKNRIIDGAVTTFLARYGSEPSAFSTE